VDEPSIQFPMVLPFKSLPSDFQQDEMICSSVTYRMDPADYVDALANKVKRSTQLRPGN
jgi:hypothetical protein